MWRWSLLVVLLVGAGGCAKPKDLPEIAVPASSAENLASFRAGLGERFTPEQLQPFVTALDELKLDAMNRGVATAEAREQDMRATVDQKTVQAVLVLGWTARRNRLLREIADMNVLLEQNLKLQEKTAATGTPESVTTHLHNAQDILARLRLALTDAERRLADWGVTPAPAGPPQT